MRFGFSDNAQALGDAGYAKSVLRAQKPPMIVVMNDEAVSLDFYNATGGATRVIHRDVLADDADLWRYTAPEAYAERLLQKDKLLTKYALNEPGAGNRDDWRAMSLWLAKLVRYMTDRGHSVCVGNYAAGAFQLEDILAGVFDPLLEALHERRQLAFLGIHEYTGVLLPFGVGTWTREQMLDAAAVKWSAYPSPAVLPAPTSDYHQRYFHLLRSSWFDVRALKLGLSVPRKLVTEFRWDYMPDMTENGLNVYAALQSKYGIADGHTSLRGPYTFQRVWAAYYPGETTSSIIHKQLAWAEGIYPSSYEGFALFMWSNDEWAERGFNYGSDKDLYSKLITVETEKPMVDLLEYIRGDGRIYDLYHTWSGGGSERIQTQREPSSRRFFHVKNNLWEELWYTDSHIWRGTDTSPEPGQLYQNGSGTGGAIYGTPWVKRQMTVGEQVRNVTRVTFRYKGDGRLVENKQPYDFTYWIRLHAVHASYTFPSGVKLNDVIELWGFLDANGKPGVNFERYWYAKGYGLVAWSDPTKGWQSYITGTVAAAPPLQRETIGWLILPAMPEASFPEVPAASDTRWKEVLINGSGSSANIRRHPSTNTTVVGSLLATPAVEAFLHEEASVPEGANKWYPIRVKSSGISGWVRSDVIEWTPKAAVANKRITVNFAVGDVSLETLWAAVLQLAELMEDKGAQVTLG